MKPRQVKKPWGYELIWADTEHYVGKILVVRAGHALSLQYHDEKDETMYIAEGLAEVTVERERYLAGYGHSFRITPRIVHRVKAIEDTTILEASTPHLDDVVRLEDRYDRCAPVTSAGSELSS